MHGISPMEEAQKNHVNKDARPKEAPIVAMMDQQVDAETRMYFGDIFPKGDQQQHHQATTGHEHAAPTPAPHHAQVHKVVKHTQVHKVVKHVSRPTQPRIPPALPSTDLAMPGEEAATKQLQRSLTEAYKHHQYGANYRRPSVPDGAGMSYNPKYLTHLKDGDVKMDVYKDWNALGRLNKTANADLDAVNKENLRSAEIDRALQAAIHKQDAARHAAQAKQIPPTAIGGAHVRSTTGAATTTPHTSALPPHTQQNVAHLQQEIVTLKQQLVEEKIHEEHAKTQSKFTIFMKNSLTIQFFLRCHSNFQKFRFRPRHRELKWTQSTHHPPMTKHGFRSYSTRWMP